MLKELQQFLMGKELDLVDAVNLDGGGSSQLFIAGTKNSEEVFVSGGDNVPVFLVVEKKR
jgi:exopolysaccharide biosynthesis protein